MYEMKRRHHAAAGAASRLARLAEALAATEEQLLPMPESQWDRPPGLSIQTQLAKATSLAGGRLLPFAHGVFVQDRYQLRRRFRHFGSASQDLLDRKSTRL